MGTGMGVEPKGEKVRRPGLIVTVLGLVALAAAAAVVLWGRPGAVRDIFLLYAVAVGGFLLLAGLKARGRGAAAVLPPEVTWLWLGGFGLWGSIVAYTSWPEVVGFVAGSEGMKTRSLYAIGAFGPLLVALSALVIVVSLVGKRRR